MKKIPTLFKRDISTNLITQVVTSGCEWVFGSREETIATRKYDGTACMIRDNIMYKRYDCKKGKIPPLSFIPSQAPDEITGHWPGWIWCDPNNNDNKYHYEALRNMYIKENYNPFILIINGTYELIGEKINGNPEKIEGHRLIRHGIDIIDKKEFKEFDDFKLNFFSIKNYLKTHDIEGIVFYKNHISMFTKMCKIKKKDFEFERE